MKVQKQSKFWMVIKDGTTYTKHRHDNKQSAEKEAARLAKKLGGVFHVLECVSSFENETFKCDHNAKVVMPYA